MDVKIAIAIAIVLLASCLLVCCFAYERAKRWKTRSEEQTRLAAQGLGQAGQHYHDIKRAARPHLPDDPEPYGPIARELDQQLVQIHTDYRECCTQYQQISAQHLPAPTNPLRHCWNILSSEFSYWRRRDQETGAHLESVAALGALLDQAEESAQNLRIVPLKAARRARDLHHQVDEMSPLVQALQRAGMHGPAFERATVRASELQYSLAQLPGWCALGVDDDILDQADKASTIRAWQLLADLEEPVAEHLAALQNWHAVHRVSGGNLNALQRTLLEARARLAQVPGTIDVEDSALQLDALAARLPEMQARHLAPTVQDLQALRPRILPDIEAANELQAQFASISEDHERLRLALQDASPLIGRAQAEMAALAHASEYPIAWGSAGEDLTEMQQALGRIGALADSAHARTA